MNPSSEDVYIRPVIGSQSLPNRIKAFTVAYGRPPKQGEITENPYTGLDESQQAVYKPEVWPGPTKL